MPMYVKRCIAKQLGGFPKTYDEQSKLDAKRAKQAERDAKKSIASKTQVKGKLSDFKICACCGEKFRVYGNVASNHCGVCWNVFGPEYMKSIDKLPDKRKCELYKIHREKCNDEVKSMTPPELHQNLPPGLNIRLQPTSNVVMTLMCAKQRARILENKKHKKRKFTCFRCGDVYMLEGEHPEPFICDRCKAYDEEHMQGTKLRDLPGLPPMTYEHLALLPEYAACAFTKHMTAKELEKLKMFRTKIRPPKRSFSELISEV